MARAGGRLEAALEQLEMAMGHLDDADRGDLEALVSDAMEALSEVAATLDRELEGDPEDQDP